jgi:hypothetical protein
MKQVSNDGNIWTNFHFAKPVLAGEDWSHKPLLRKAVLIGMDPAALLLLRRYMTQTQAGAGR